MKLVIGLIGENGSGKDTFTTFFRAEAATKKVKRIKFSDILGETLNAWGIPASRSNLQNLAIVMDGQFGKGTLTTATSKRIHDGKADVFILEGIRWATDIQMLKNFENSILVYITADPKIRFERMKKRKEKVGEKDLTYERFQREEKAKTETDIPKLGQKADFLIENNGSFEEFREKVREVVQNIK